MRKQNSTLGVLFALSAGSLFAAPPPSAEMWKAPAGINIRQVSPEVLAIRYDLIPDKGEMNGNYPRKVKDADLMLKKPISLARGTERILFEAHSIVCDSKHVSLGLELRPIIRDCDGELFYFFPKEGAAIKRRSNQGWDFYTTAMFHSGEAGTASHGTCTVGGNITNSRPDGALELVGFRLHLTQPENKPIVPRKGVVYLGDVSFSGMKVPFRNPDAFPGAFLKKKGDYTLAGQIFTEFQNTPVREFSDPVSFDPDDIAGSRKRLEFKLGPDGHYWINYQILDEKGNVAASDSMKYQMFDSPEKKRPVPIDPAKAPSIGFMRINPGRKGNGVYEIGEPFRITVRVFPKEKRDLKLKYELYPYCSADLLDSGTQAVGSGDFALNFRKHPKFNVFRLKLKLQEKGKTIDSASYIFGEKTDFTRKLIRAGKKINRQELKKRPYQRFSYVLLSAKRWQKPMKFYVDDFRNYLQDTFEFTPHGTICPDLNDFEVLPGVFDFSLLDEMMELAADYGCKLTIRFAHSDLHAGSYRWGKFSRQISADGIVAGAGIPYGAYEVTDPALVKFWLDAYRALYMRYSEHTAFAGYYIMQPAGEWTVVDQPWDGVVSGYSSAAVQSFRDYLKNTLKLDLAGVNGRWGTQYRTFSEIQPPMPTFESGTEPDLRMRWLDFCRFKAGLGRFWLSSAVNDIRSYDNERVTIAYAAPNSVDHLKGKLDYGHNGGNHSMNRRGAYCAAWKKYRVGWITEPIHPHGWAAFNDPGKGGWVLDVSIWTMLAQAGGGGSNLHVYYYSLPGGMVHRYGGFYAFDRFERFKPVLRELHDAELIFQPAEIAFRQDPETLWSKHRTTFSARLDDLGRWRELAENDGIPYAELQNFPGKKFKLLLPNILDEVISADVLRNYVQRIQQDGSCMIMTANTGKYVPELGRKPFQLLKALGITPPDRKYVTTGSVKAQSLPGNPLFEPGRTFDIQTLTSMRKQNHSPEVRKAFWHYPYRWIPETDYFGYYPEQKPNGTVLARFPDGGAALSLHKSGKGQVLVFWGTPDMSSNKLSGMLKRAADWAGVRNPLAGMEIPDVVEMTNRKAKRHYLLAYSEDRRGTFRVKLPNCPDGTFFLDEMVGDLKLGTWTGKQLREEGIRIPWNKDASPLKILRAIPVKGIPVWRDSYGKGNS